MHNNTVFGSRPVVLFPLSELKAIAIVHDLTFVLRWAHELQRIL